MDGRTIEKGTGEPMDGWCYVGGDVTLGTEDDAYLEFSKYQSCHFSGRLSISMCVRWYGGGGGIIANGYCGGKCLLMKELGRMERWKG